MGLSTSAPLQKRLSRDVACVMRMCPESSRESVLHALEASDNDVYNAVVHLNAAMTEERRIELVVVKIQRPLPKYVGAPTDCSQEAVKTALQAYNGVVYDARLHFSGYFTDFEELMSARYTVEAVLAIMHITNLDKDNACSYLEGRLTDAKFVLSQCPDHSLESVQHALQSNNADAYLAILHFNGRVKTLQNVETVMFQCPEASRDWVIAALQGNRGDTHKTILQFNLGRPTFGIPTAKPHLEVQWTRGAAVESSDACVELPPEPDAVLHRLIPGFQLGLHKPNFEKCICDVDPFLRLRREKSKLNLSGTDVLWVLVENVSSFPVMLMPMVSGGRFLKETNERMPNTILHPGEIHKLTRFSTDEERYRMDCYASGLPHFPCDGISKRVDPTSIILVCQPAARDSEGWCAMSTKDGVSRPEAWAVYIDHVDEGASCLCYVKWEIMQTCVFSDDRRPLKSVNVALEDVRHCQDSCGQTFRDGRSLESTVKELKEGSVTVAELGIRVVAFDSIYFALDNRRLKCAKLAFPPTQNVPVLLADLADPATKKEWVSKFTVGKRIPTHKEARHIDANNVGEHSQLDEKSRHSKPRPYRKHTPEAADPMPGSSEFSASQLCTCAQCH